MVTTCHEDRHNPTRRLLTREVLLCIPCREECVGTDHLPAALSPSISAVALRGRRASLGNTRPGTNSVKRKPPNRCPAPLLWHIAAGITPREDRPWMISVRALYRYGSGLRIPLRWSVIPKSRSPPGAPPLRAALRGGVRLGRSPHGLHSSRLAGGNGRPHLVLT